MANTNASPLILSSGSMEQQTHMSLQNTNLPQQNRNISDGPIAILWDMENCPVLSDIRPEDVAGNIRMALQVHPKINGAVTVFSAYGDFNKFSRRLREGCQRTGVKLVDVPNGRKDAADKAILVDMFLFALDNPPPSYIMLISGDVDFSHALHVLGQRGYTVIIAIPSGVGVSSALRNAGSFVWDWPSVVRGEGFVPSSRPVAGPNPVYQKMSGNNRQSNRKSDNNDDNKIKQTHTCFRIDSEPIPKITSDGSPYGASCSEKDESPLNEKSAVEDMSSGNLDFKEKLSLLDEDSTSKKLKNISHESQENKRYDICHKSVSKAVKLKPPMAVINREKRNQLNRSKQGQNIIMLRPGMVLMKGYISFNDQVSIVKRCRELGLSDGGFYQPAYREMMCLGKNWDPQSRLYSDTRPSDNAKPPGIPDTFSDMVKKAIRDSNAYLAEKNPNAYAGQLIPSMSPDICIVNFYTESGKLGLHQDKDESPKTLKQGLPVVSFSIGDSSDFLYGDDRDIDKADKVILESGDVLIFGGKSRLVFHGVTSILPMTAPISLLDATDMIAGRLNLTFRRY